MRDSKLDSVSTIHEPELLRISIATNTMAGVTLDQLLRRIEDCLRGHSYCFKGTLQISEEE